jgi:hypothetical protein
MNHPAVKIDELRLRVHGLSRREAGQLGEQVARELAAQLPASAAPRHIGSIHVRVKARAGDSPGRLSTTIAGSIARRIA